MHNVDIKIWLWFMYCFTKTKTSRKRSLLYYKLFLFFLIGNLDGNDSRRNDVLYVQYDHIQFMRTDNLLRIPNIDIRCTNIHVIQAGRP